VDSKTLGKIWNPHIERELSSTRYATFFLINSNFIETVSRGMRRLASINKPLIYCTPSTVKESQQ
jgi:predicted aldo/keto reductase-like oxidoreductase